MKIEKTLIAALAQAGLTLATAESCTGGMIASRLVSVPGASRVFCGGVVSYTNDIKQRLLGVDGTLLETLGAVSAPVAEAMAVGARSCLQSDLAVSVTGLAGPGGGTAACPCGRVYIGVSTPHKTYARQYDFAGNRRRVRRKAADAALREAMAAYELIDNPKGEESK